MPTAKKEATITELRERLGGSKHLFFTNYAGFSVDEVTKLRSELRKDGSTYAVVKNSLFSIAAGDDLAKQLEGVLAGPTGVIFSNDPVAPARAIKQFSTDVRPLQVKAAYVDGQILGAEAINALASLPSKAELQAKVLGLLVSPMAKFVGLMGANQGGFVRVLSAREKQFAESLAAGSTPAAAAGSSPAEGA